MKNYYEVLGVERNAPLDQIKKAYRKLVRKYHPDMGESSDLERFLEIQKAFEVLSNEQRRAEYDRDLAEAEKAEIPRWSTTSIRFTDWPFENWISWVFHSPRYTPRVEAWLAESGQILEIIFTPAELKSSSFVPVEIPILRTCPKCRGTGFERSFLCFTCLGSGVVRSVVSIKLPIPAENQFNQILEFDLMEVGIHGILRTIFKIRHY